MFESMPSSADAVAETAHDVVTRLFDAVPSIDTMVALQAIKPEDLDDYDRISRLSLWARHVSWAEAQLQHALVDAAGDEPKDSRDDWSREDVACALRLSSGAAGARLQVARELDGRLARTGDALEAGAITYGHARAMVQALMHHEDPIARQVELVVLTEMHRDETLTEFRRRLSREVIAAEPEIANVAHRCALEERKVVMWPEPFGMATVQATLTADEAAQTMAAVTALAHSARGEGDNRPLDALRADAFAGLFAAALADPTLPREQRVPPWVGVTIDYATLIGLADNPGHLAGYGPIPPVLARRLAADADWQRLVTEPVTGALLDYGHTVYRPPAELVEFVVARDRTCRFPTCMRSARLCDIDHAQPYDDGGDTSAANTGPLCRRNHGQKTDGRWTMRVNPDGSVTWTSRTGHEYVRPPVDHHPEHTRHLRRLRIIGSAEIDSGASDNDSRASDPDPPPF